MTENKPFQTPRVLWLLQICYTCIVLLANWFDSRSIKLFSFITDAGTIIFPLTFLLSSLITEIYGYKFARRAIWAGFLFNIIFIAYSQLIINLPSPAYDLKTNNDFNKILDFNLSIIVVSSISYLLTQPLNAYILAKLKLKTLGRYMPFRFICSIITASFLDGLIFCGLAFYNGLPNYNLMTFIFNMWGIKIIVEICVLPIAIRLANIFKHIEKLDMYDKETNFNLFSLDATYFQNDNLYKRK